MGKFKSVIYTAIVAALIFGQAGIVLGQTSKLHVEVGLNHFYKNRYLEAYKEVRELYQSINEILFSNFNANLCPKGDK